MSCGRRNSAMGRCRRSTGMVPERCSRQYSGTTRSPQGQSATGARSPRSPHRS
jgi:hypothetical protein